MPRAARLALLLLAGLTMAQAAPNAPQPAPLPEETSDTRTLPPVSPRWVFLTNNVTEGGTRIVDGDTGKMLGTVPGVPLSSFAIVPDGSRFLVAESIWTKANRGTRQDLLAVYDATTLKLTHEITLSGRQLITFRRHLLGVSADGSRAYVYDMNPASSAIVIDLAGGQQVNTVELPGCALTMAVGADRFASLCGNGTIATTQVGSTPASAASARFFDADVDPIYDNSFVDTKAGRAVLLSYTGLVIPVHLDGKPSPSERWSIQESAGLRRGTAAPVEVNWRPGGREPMTVHARSHRLYVLMHLGEYWSQKRAGTELWVLDLTTRKLIARRALPRPVQGVVVGQDESPLLFLNAVDGGLIIWDATTLEAKHDLAGIGNGIMTVYNPR